MAPRFRIAYKILCLPHNSHVCKPRTLSANETSWNFSRSDSAVTSLCGQLYTQTALKWFAYYYKFIPSCPFTVFCDFERLSEPVTEKFRSDHNRGLPCYTILLYFLQKVGKLCCFLSLENHSKHCTSVVSVLF